MNYEPPKWASKYIGINYKENGRSLENGVDCWGLLHCIYENEFGLTLPSYNEKYEKYGNQYKLHDNDYSFLMDNWQKVTLENKQLGDLILFDMNDIIFHAGMVIAKHKFIHVHSGIETVIDELSSLQWENRISELYRHNELSIS